MKNIFDYFVEYFFVIMFIIASFLSLVFWEPEKQYYLFIDLIGAAPQTGFDLPSVWVWLFIFICLIMLGDNFFITEKAYHSDDVWANGIDYCPSCVASTLSIVGEWAYIRTEGIKRFTVMGNNVLNNLATHTHKIGSTIIFEGHIVPNTPLSHVPNEIKADVRQTRYGLFGSSLCGVGYLSDIELKNHKEFNSNDIPEIQAYLEEGEKGKIFQTQTFIDILRDLNRDLNMIVEFNDGERESLTKYLQNVIELGRGMSKSQEPNFVDRLMGK